MDLISCSAPSLACLTLTTTDSTESYYFDLVLKVTDDRFEGQELKYKLYVYFEKFHTAGRPDEPVLVNDFSVNVMNCIVHRAILSPDIARSYEYIVT
jgi:hypothetical protein